VVGGQRNVAVAIVCWWSHSQPGFWLLTVASGAEWLFRGLRSGGRGLGVPLRPNPFRPTPWASDGVPGEGSIPAPLPPPFARLCAPTYDLLRSYVFEPSLVRDSVGACPRHATLRIAAAGAIATMVDSIVLARAVGDKRLSDSLLEAGRQALHHQAAGASAGACPAGSI
jgi:hypothetical protein